MTWDYNACEIKKGGATGLLLRPVELGGVFSEGLVADLGWSLVLEKKHEPENSHGDFRENAGDFKIPNK